MSEKNEMERIYGSHQEQWAENKSFEQPSGIWGREPMMKYLQEKVIKPGDTVVDLGSGGGGPTAKIAEMVGADGHVTGIEISKTQLGLTEGKESLRKKYKNIDNLSFINADIASLPIKNESVDTVVSFMVLHDLDMDNIEKTMEEVARVMKPNGRTVILTMHPDLFESEQWDVPFWNYDQKKIEKYKEAKNKEGLKIPGKIMGMDGKEKNVEVITHTKDNYLKAIQSAGLEIVSEQNMYLDEKTAKEKYGDDRSMRLPTQPAYWMITLKKIASA